jgi:hypothetical protein
LQRLHDQLLPPRATLCWGGTSIPGFEDAVRVSWETDPRPLLRSLYRQLMSGERASEADRLPDHPPAPWRGVGEHGQGGKGMMGGMPYGRPMAMTADDLRDGLALDTFTVQIGPFLPTLPAGLVLELTLQGDVIQQARMLRPPFAQDGADARRAPVAQRLYWIARLFELLELHAWAVRARLLAQRPGDLRPDALAALRRGVQRAGVFLAVPTGLGVLGSSTQRIDVRTRLMRWFDEAASALQDGSPARPDAANESAAVPRAILEDALRGLEWNEAMLVLASVDPDRLRAGFTAPNTAEPSP